MEIRWLGEVCSALPSSGGRGHSCDHQAMPLIETLYVVETLYAIWILAETFFRHRHDWPLRISLKLSPKIFRPAMLTGPCVLYIRILDIFSQILIARRS